MYWPSKKIDEQERQDLELQLNGVVSSIEAQDIEVLKTDNTVDRFSTIRQTLYKSERGE